MSPTITITVAAVKVMRSFDYCHFEICLSTSSTDTDALSPIVVDDLRKTAARLADKAVEQYKSAKENARRAELDAYQLRNLREDAERISKIPESERTPRQKAVLKTIQDREHWKRTRYDYEDDWEEEGDWDPAEDVLF